MEKKDNLNGPYTDCINIHENYDVEHWANILGVSPNWLRETVKKIGTNVADVRDYLNN